MINLIDIQTVIKVEKTCGRIATSATRLVSLNDAGSEGDIAWCSKANASTLIEKTAGIYICHVDTPENFFNKEATYLLVKEPRLAFLRIAQKFFQTPLYSEGIAASAFIHESSKLGKNVSIGHNVVIEANCVIGDRCIVGHNSTIHKDTNVGRNVKIGASSTIGGVGFGYEINEEGKYERIPHLGNVIIEEDVEIGNNTAIDRAVLGSTLLKRNCKIDNLVHIAHGVEVGENSLIIANAMVAGSCKIGNNTWVGPSVSVRDQVKIGNDALLGVGSCIVKNVDDGVVVAGNPARVLRSR